MKSELNHTTNCSKR